MINIISVAMHESLSNPKTAIMQTVEASAQGLSLTDLVRATGLKRTEVLHAVTSLALLGLLREEIDESGKGLWLDRSKFFRQKLVDFNPALIEFNAQNPNLSICKLLPEHKSDIVKAISSIPFYFHRDFGNPSKLVQEDSSSFYAFKRSFETFLYEGVFEADEDSRYIDSSHCCSRSLFRCLESISTKGVVQVNDLARINALFEDDFEPSLDGTRSSPLRSGPVTFKDSLYHPLKGQKSVQFYINKVLTNAQRVQSPLDRAFYLNLNTMYVQPFAHANKRTAAVAANAGLLGAGLAPYTHSMHSRDSFISAFLDYCEYADPEPMSYVFSQAVIQSSVKFEQTFHDFHEVLKVVEPSEIKKVAANIVNMMFKENLSPNECIASTFPQGVVAPVIKIVRSEVSNLLWQLDQDAIRHVAGQSGNPMLQSYIEYKEAVRFDSSLADKQI